MYILEFNTGAINGKRVFGAGLKQNGHQARGDMVMVMSIKLFALKKEAVYLH